MSDRVFSSEDKAKLTQLVNEGITVMQEVDDLNDGLNDTIKAIAEEMQIKPTVLKKHCAQHTKQTLRSTVMNTVNLRTSWLL